MGRTLMEHAAYELTLAGMTTNADPEARKIATDTLALVKRFEKQSHTERTGSYTLEMFEILCNMLPLSPLSDDPDEWEKFEIDRKNIDTGEGEKKIVWQSKRATSIFSEDEGKTFYDQKTGKTGDCVDHIKLAEDVAKQEADRVARKKAAEERAKNPVPTAVMNPIPAGEETHAVQEDVEPPMAEGAEPDKSNN